MKKEKIQYNNIDLFKIIFAIIVVMIHTAPFRDISETASWYFSNIVGNLAVPFFFVTSGFLLFGKLKNCDYDSRDKSVKKYLIHIVRMYLIWCVIWIPWKALHYYNIGYFNLSELVNYIRNIIFVSGGDALWYLPALTAAVGAVYILRYKFKVPRFAILLLSLILYVVGCLISSWYKLFEGNILVETYYNIFVTVDNGILCGMVFVAIGMIIAENEKKSGIVLDAVGFITMFSLMVIESFVINKTGLSRAGVANNIMLPGAVFFMFKLILGINIDGKEDNFRKVRDYSTLIYLSHCFIIRSIKLLTGIVGINISYIFLFIITLLLAFIFAVCIRNMSAQKRFAWVKLLY